MLVRSIFGIYQIKCNWLVTFLPYTYTNDKKVGLTLNLGPVKIFSYIYNLQY